MMLAPIYRVLIDLALKEALSRKKSEGNVFVFMDELALAPNLQHIETGINFGRSLGLKFAVGIQNVAQVYHAYGDERGQFRGQSILSGFGTVFAFRLFDQASRDFVAQRYGSNRKQLHLESTMRHQGIKDEHVEGKVIEDWSLAGLTVGKCIVSMPEGPPFVFDFKPFRQNA